MGWRLLCGVLILAHGCHTDRGSSVTVEFWALGREGEVVKEFVPAFEAAHPGVTLKVQQIPWSAAHEKLLTAYVGRATPDLAQVGNTWIPELVALGALEDLTRRCEGSAVVASEHYFPGIWATNVLDHRVYGVPWYVDTRVLFYRKDLLEAAGWPHPPRSWSEWRAAMAAVKGLPGAPERFGILLPIDEWVQPVVLAMQLGSPLLGDGGRYGAFSEEPFARAFTFYTDLFRQRLAPLAGLVQIANVYQQFAEGHFAMYITGPWNLGEFRRRLPEEVQQSWATAPLPAPDGTDYPGVSLAGGASLVVFRGSRRQEEAWKVVEFLSRPDVQVEFFRRSGDLPAHREAWRHPVLASDPHAAAFAVQLERVQPTPQVPEWERIAQRLWEAADQVIRGGRPVARALQELDRDVDAMLQRRRDLLQRGGEGS